MADKRIILICYSHSNFSYCCFVSNEDIFDERVEYQVSKRCYIRNKTISYITFKYIFISYFPENEDIHMNDNVNLSLSSYYQSNAINMFHVIAHEIGYSLSLNRISDPNYIMFLANIHSI